mmetsp:Transcript_10536/g.9298  ORF Transcript_10536/g.9298 Transcript_10536/m.9298 type:complete len:104 (+) Transcript_10536:521-832(+)
MHEYSANAERDLSRYEFLEVLVRIANEKYKNILEPHKALQALLKDHIYKYKSTTAVTDFRMKKIFTIGIENYIKKNDLILRNFYNTFIHGVKNYFTCKDAVEM